MSDVISSVESTIGNTVSSTMSGVGSSFVGYIVAAVAVVITVLGGWVYMLKADITLLTTQVNEQKALVALKDVQINGFVAAVDRQNEAIEKMRVDTLQASKELAATSKVIENRYSTVTVADKTCEGKVKAYENMLKVFFSRK